MVASLLKIISTGMQDERLQPPKGQPDLSAFLKVLIRTGRYATNWTRIDFDTSPDFGKSSIIRLPTKGEMIGRIFLVTNMPDISTIQKTAYYSRKPTFIANSNYTISNQFSGTDYVRSTSYTYPVSGGNLGIAKFTGIQIDDLSLGGTYTLTGYLPQGAIGTTSFSILLTDKPLNNEQIRLLNEDTYYLVGAGNYLIYSYDGINWANISLSASFLFNNIKNISYNRSTYILSGNFKKYTGFITIDGDSTGIIQPYLTNIDSTTMVISNCIAYNGSLYVSVGVWNNADSHIGSISYSTDGIRWVSAFDPSNVDSVTSNIGYSVVWVESTSKWVATGSWSYNKADPANTVYYMVATSPDGINWTAQNLNSTYILSQDNTASLYSTGYSIAVNGSNLLIGGIIYTNGSIDGGLLFSSNGGSTWTILTILSTTYAVAWTGNVWVAVGDYQGASISLSPDGITWSLANNPSGTYYGIGYAIGLNSTDLLIGGNWTLVDGSSTGSLSKASGNSLEYKWGDMVRPTSVFNNSVIINSISYDSTSNIYILMGSWKDSNMNLLGTISLSTDGRVWSEPIIPSNQNLTQSYANAAATNGTLWVVVGQWYTPNNTSGYTISYSDTLTQDSYTNWNFADSLVTGVANNVIYDSTSSIFIVVGDWTGLGYIQASGVGNTIFSGGPIYPLDSNGGTTSGFATSIIVTATPNVYLITGNIYDSKGILYTVVEVTATITGGIVSFTITNMLNPQDIDLTQPQVMYDLAYNGAFYVAVGKFTMLDGSISTITSIASKGGNYYMATPINPPDVISSPTIVGTGVSWNGTQFIALGTWDIATIISSTDGYNWTLPANPPGASGTLNTGKNGIWNGSTWVVCGNWFNNLDTSIGNVISFTYGINFSKPVNPIAALYGTTKSIGWDGVNNKWTAAGSWSDLNNNTGQLSNSSNALVWETPSSITSIQSSKSSISQVRFINGSKYIIGSLTYNDCSMSLSTDLTNWSLVDIPNLQGTTANVCWNGSIWVAVSNSGYTITTWGTVINGVIITSTDGINWSQPIIPIVPITPVIQEIIIISLGVDNIMYTYSLNDVAWNGSYFVAIGSIKIISLITGIIYNISHIISSTDGVTWTAQTISPADIDINYTIETKPTIANSVNWNGNTWLVTGKFSNFNNGTTFTSSDSINWTVAMGLKDSAPNAIGSTWNSSRWVAIYQSAPFITTSIDGVNWSPAIDPSNGDTTQVYSIAWNGTQYLILGVNSFGNGTLFTSLDGLNWVYTSNTSLPQLQGILTKRSKPYLTPEPFDNSINTEYSIQANGYTLSWVRDTTYGTGNQYYSNLTNGEPITFTFTASTRAKWLTFGTYYNAQSAVDISLNLIRLGDTTFKSDLVGPHFGWTNNLGHCIIDNATISIGGNLVETIPGQLMEVLDEFQTPLEKVPAKNRQLCRSDNGFNQTTYGYNNTNQEVITHLPFWFSRGDPGCVLPIDALNVDEVRLTVNFKPLTSVYYTNSRAANPTVNVEGGALWPLLNSQFYYKDSSGIILTNLEPTRVKAIDNPVLPFPNLKMPNTLSLQDTYLLVEYIYLDKAEANRFRIADIQVPIVQHYTIDPVDTNGTTYARIPLDIPNPTRDLFFYCQRYEAPSVNAHFLATRDICKPTDPNPYAIWWPDASGLDDRYYGTLKPGFSSSGSEPIRWLALNYAETLNRYSTENVALFRSMLPAIEQRKAPWVNRYYYNIPFGCQNGLNPISTPLGEANLDKVQRISLSLGFHGKTGEIADAYTERFLVRVYAETYNIFRVYGGRGAMMFAY